MTWRIYYLITDKESLNVISISATTINIPRFSYRKLKSNANKELNTTSCDKNIQENTPAIETDHLYNSVLTAIQIQEFIVLSLKLLFVSLLVLWNFQWTLMTTCLFILLLLEIHKRIKQIIFSHSVVDFIDFLSFLL